MSTQDAVIVAAVVGFVAGWLSLRWRLQADIAAARKTLGKASDCLGTLRADIRSVRELARDAGYKAGFADGVAAYPMLNDEGRRELLEAWSSQQGK